MSIESCGTPAVAVFVSLKLLLILYSSTFIEKPYACSFASKTTWLIVSKAFDRSINKTRIFSFLIRAFLYSSSMVTIECWVPCNFLKPVINFERLLFIYTFICLYMILSKTFDKCYVLLHLTSSSLHTVTNVNYPVMFPFQERNIICKRISGVLPLLFYYKDPNFKWTK